MRVAPGPGPVLPGHGRPGRREHRGVHRPGKGSVAAKPNRLEIDLEVSAASELTADAIVKYRDAKKRLQEAFAALKLDNVAVEERGLLVDQKGQMYNPYFFGHTSPTRRAKTEVQLTRKLVVKCTDIRKMDEEALLQLVAKLLDVAQDAGGKVGGQNDYQPLLLLPLRPMHGGPGPVRPRRLRQAPGGGLREGDRRRPGAGRAAGQAEPASSSGRSSAVREVVVPGENAAMASRRDRADDEMPRKRLESSKFQEIPVRVELLVRFDVQSQGRRQGRRRR